MPEFIIHHGGIKMGGRLYGPGEFITLDESEAQRMDPTGECLQLRDEYEIELIGDKAAEEAMAKARVEAEAKIAAAKAEAQQKAKDAKTAAIAAAKGGAK